MEENKMNDGLNIDDINVDNIDDIDIPVEQQSTIEEIDPLDILVNHDFSKDEEIDLDESYEVLNIIERDRGGLEQLEAEEIIKTLGNIYITKEYKEKIDQCVDNIKSYIKKYSIEKPENQNLSEKEKDKLFAIGSFLVKNLVNVTDEIEFVVKISQEEYKFIFHVLERKLEYDGDEVFNFIDLNETHLKEWKQLEKSLTKNDTHFNIKISIKKIVMLYHFLKKHKVKGMGKDFYIFANILKKIAETNKIYNAYGVIRQRINSDFSLWVSSLEYKEEEKSNVKIVQNQEEGEIKAVEIKPEENGQ